MSESGWTSVQADNDNPRAWPWPWMAVALLLPCFVAILAVPRLISGMAQEAAFPNTTYLTLNVPLARATYQVTEEILGRAPTADGITATLRAEAAAKAGEPTETVLGITRSALAHDPGSARGWMVLARVLRDRDPQEATQALSLAIELAPREYYLIPPRAAAGAPLWQRLPQEEQARILNDAKFLASDPDFRPALLEMLAAPGGPALLGRAMADQPEKLRVLNRSLARERLGLP